MDSGCAVASAPPLAPVSVPAAPLLIPPEIAPALPAAAAAPLDLSTLQLPGGSTIEATALLNLLATHIAEDGGLPLGRKLKM